MSLEAKDFIKVFKKKGYKFFKNGVYNLNIIGVRSENSVSDKFDDVLHVLYMDEQRVKHHKKYAITTDPGKHYLMNPLNKKGTIIMVPNQYRGVYKIGLHNRSNPSRSYKALEQIKPMRYVRDNNKDNILDFSLIDNPDNHICENAKTNIHRSSQWKNLLNIGLYSAGCQVFQKPAEFKEFMELCEKQVESGYGETFSYTLVNEKDFS